MMKKVLTFGIVLSFILMIACGSKKEQTDAEVEFVPYEVEISIELEVDTTKVIEIEKTDLLHEKIDE